MSGPLELAPVFPRLYARLGLDIAQCPQMLAEINRILKTVRGGKPVGDTVLHATVHHIANSIYAKTFVRAPTLWAAAMGGAFAPASRSYILNYPFLARAADDIRNPLPLITWIQEEKFNQVDRHNVPALLTEIVVVGAICDRMNEKGFNSAACRQMIFENAGVETSLAAILSNLEASDPALELALNDWLKVGNAFSEANQNLISNR